MKRIICAVFTCLFVAFAGADAYAACTANQIDVKGDGTQCEDSKFELTTTNLSANDSFLFSMSAKGTFYVDWGDGTVETIIRTDTTNTEYSHTYTIGGVKTIKFGGLATEYNSATGDNVVAAIAFYKATGGTQTKIAGVSGSLGAVFPTIGNGTAPNLQPRFRSTFQSTTNLTSVPANLFNGVSGSAESMFRSTFDRSGLTAIPYGLFANATGGAQNMFRSTFYTCTSLASLPDDLFAGITVAVQDEFRWTFYKATGLNGKYIPATAFTGLVDAGAPSPATGNMWYQTFDGSNLLKSCPSRTRPFITGYETAWNGFVSCEPSNPCVGAQYWDSTNEVCTPCPTGYTYDTSNAKDSINQCKIQCADGTYLAAAGNATCTNAGVGYYAAGGETNGVYNYGQTSTRTKCPDDMPTINNTTTASSIDQCVVYCRGNKYRNSNNSCVDCPTGYVANPADGKTAITDCKIHCDGGTYLPIANAPSCEDVGDGYWAVATTVAYGSTVSRTQCPTGQTTGMTNASSASQCMEALCTGATYRDSVTGKCISCPIGYDAHTVSGKTSINECQIHCYAGTYIANANDTVCTNVGDGYYAAASDVNYGSTGSRGQCPNGQTTGTQTAASSSQCQTSCMGAQYYDSATGACKNCPTGYTDNVTNGKNNINQCQHYCEGGAYAQTFTRISYLESDGTQQFIDTGYEITGNHVNGVLVVATTASLPQDKDHNYGNFFGNLYGPGGFSANHKGGAFGLWMQASGQGDKAKYNTTFNVGQQYTLTYDVSVENTTYNSQKKADFGTGNARLKVDGNNASPYPRSLGGININADGNSFKLFTNGGAAVVNGVVMGTNWGDKLFSGRIYSLTLYENDVLVLDLIPVRRESDGALGMYNRVNNDFYGNAGLGDFTAGPDMNEMFIGCIPVGNGYYVGANYTNFGSQGTRNQCPNGLPTMENGEIINNATSIYQCDGVNPCVGATYPDPNTGVCILCPGDFMSAFLKNLALRKSCGKCPFNRLPRMGDLTIGDFWGIKRKYDDLRGTSVILANNSRGEKLLSRIKRDLKLLKQTELQSALPGNPCIFESTSENPLRERFFENLDKKTLHENVSELVNYKYDYLCLNFYTSLNYGAVLTAYAAQELLAELGYTSAHIDYRYPHITNDKYNDSFTDNFVQKYLVHTQQCKNIWNFNDVAQMARRGFIVGSDQVFRDDYISKTYFYYLLGFAPVTKQRIALAASFGKDSFDLPVAQQFFDCFDAISVREDDGLKFVKDAKHLLDPVFLADTNIFHKLADSVKTPKCKILGYVLDKTDEKFDRNIAYENVSVEEYLSYIKNADLVVTDSFHGTCFAILFNRPFITLGNAHRGNSRFESLFRLLNITDTQNPDWHDINARIAKLRDDGKTWLQGAIKNTDVKNIELRTKLKNTGFVASQKKKVGFIQKIFSVDRYKGGHRMYIFGIKIKF